MTLSLSFERVQRTLAAGAENAQYNWRERDALLVRLADANGRLGLGECSPLPGYSPESLADCEHALRAIDPRRLPECICAADLTAALATAGGTLPRTLPAARCALETALIDLWARQLAVPAWQLLGPATGTPAARRLAALLSNLDAAAEDLRQGLARGITVFKLKIGRPGAFEGELGVARAIHGNLPPGAELRLDANQALSAGARDQLRSLAALAPQWLEEPCQPSELALLAGLGLSVALDESSCGLSVAQADALWATVPGLRAIVLKPTLLGVLACLELAARARARGLEVVLSHTFDGAPALAISAALALAVGSPAVAHGLDLAGARFNGTLPGFRPSALEPWPEPGFGGVEEPP